MIAYWNMDLRAAETNELGMRLLVIGVWLIKQMRPVGLKNRETRTHNPNPTEGWKGALICRDVMLTSVA